MSGYYHKHTGSDKTRFILGEVSRGVSYKDLVESLKLKGIKTNSGSDYDVNCVRSLVYNHTKPEKAVSMKQEQDQMNQDMETSSAKEMADRMRYRDRNVYRKPQRETTQAALAMHKEGLCNPVIAKALNDRGFRTTHGNRFRSAVVAAILSSYGLTKNPIPEGFKRRMRGPNKRKAVPRGNNHEAAYKALKEASETKAVPKARTTESQEAFWMDEIMGNRSIPLAIRMKVAELVLEKK